MTDTSSSRTVDPTAVRRKRLLFLGCGIGMAALGWAAYSWLSDGNSRSTDDAYVNGHVVTVTPQVAGTVIHIAADNADRVIAGTPLVEIDTTDARVELAAAEANLARAVRNVRGLFASDARFGAEISVAQANLDKTRADFQQRQAIAGTGAVTDEDVRHARDAVRSAEANLAAAREARAQAFAQTSGVTLASHPEVQAAAERVRAAALALARTRVVAPVSGMVAQRSVQLGRRVAPGDRLMAVVPLDGLWIDANFKEVQLDGICPGQPATVTADIYGRHVIYHGRVSDIEAGSGASFALLPAQNATGNWIKVVQRVPVRIRLDPAELARSPLRIGLSAKVAVDASHCDSNTRPAAPQSEEVALYSEQQRDADAIVARIIAASIGG
ncbi:HlyD family efflux transporter periplasmic adaptor subunit [Xanthomonas hyacinthi]|uniref:EmrA/EmrK family multidrug efflux transporter periplasmic adaptor subunit n=1 Tax=Xanthomonas hyacinthi TaxID=56455 RepID=A0A2S7EP53_9XANT|nr:efflux RND transporter periplasmic adaptor subunit [Xanthomonas hyacinthi]PPU94031.1 EmrA/EmrK family multidrug efflux transporter periplasmic adaptor subunit [Xanthomonas hyacinthi]QGY75728.1 HlyD family efflux transporter periplasmic adaptor subunit [Xanthomonas hyacinthi]